MYRDDLQAALEKIRALEAENGRLKEEVEKLQPRDPEERPEVASTSRWRSSTTSASC